jgi:excinuclease UvrABC nuclease subunit
VLSRKLEFDPAREQQVFSAAPAAPAVFLLRGDDARAEPYVSKTANLRRRLIRLLGAPEERTKRLNLREHVRRIEYTPTGSDFESSFLLYQVLRQVFPRVYAHRLRLRFAPLVKLHLDNPYPRASVTTRLGRAGSSLYYGPFPSRVDAEKFANDSLDFFKMRRCVEDLNPDPAFPGCIYSEMKMCLAPCFKGCSDQEYRAEVVQVQAYLDSRGESLVRAFSEQRDQASSNLQFERAAAWHGRLDKLRPVLSQLPEIVQRIDRLAAVIVQPSTAPECVTLFRVAAGHIVGPAIFSIPPSEHTKSQSMESRVEQALDAMPSQVARTALETMEHLALLKRWYYRGTRMGEIFFADDRGALPMRRIVRGIARVYRGEKPETAELPPSGLSPAPAS